MKMNPVVHLELPAEDRKRMSKFYTETFGWQTQQLDKEMEEYVLATTTESDQNGRPKTPGTINGGFYQKTKEMPPQNPSDVIAVDDLNESMKKVISAGGKLMGELFAHNIISKRKTINKLRLERRCLFDYMNFRNHLMTKNYKNFVPSFWKYTRKMELMVTLFGKNRYVSQMSIKKQQN